MTGETDPDDDTGGARDPRVSLAIYDLDRTITDLPTWTPFLLYAAWRLAPWRLALIPLVGMAAIARAMGVRDRDWLKEAMHRLLLGRRLDPRRLDGVVQHFADKVVRDHIQAGARRQLAADLDSGRRIVIATAAHRFYAAAIAARLGVTDLVATEASRDAAGHIRPRIAGANCYGAAKQAMIAQWLTDRRLDRGGIHIRFYSDHLSDAPTLDWVDDPVVVNASSRLLWLARERRWQTADWRE